MKKSLLSFLVLVTAISIQAQAKEVDVQNIEKVDARGQRIAMPHGETIWELCGNTLKNAIHHSVAIVDIEPGKSSVEHYHVAFEEAYYVLEGEGVVAINRHGDLDSEDSIGFIKKGDLVVIPQNHDHRVWTLGTAPLRMVVTAATPWAYEGNQFYEFDERFGTKRSHPEIEGLLSSGSR